MPTALEGLNIGEVSGVDHPAHLEEGWMVLKAAGAAPEAMAKVEIVEALVDAVEKAAAIEPDLLAQVGAEVLDASARETLAHLLPTTKAVKEATDMPEFDPASLPEGAAEYIQAQIAAGVAKAVSTEDPEATELAKALDGLPEPLRKAWEAQAEALRKATQTAEHERNTRLDAEYLEKARGFSNLTVKTEDLAGVLRKVADLDADLFVQVDQILKAANAQVAESNLFKAIGAPAAVVEQGSAHERLDAIAKAKVADGSASDYPTALAKAAEENPDLYAAHRRESIAPKEG